MPTQPEEIFESVAHDLRVCGFSARLEYGAEGVDDPDNWRTLVIGGTRIAPVEFSPEVADEPLGVAVRPVAFHVQAALLENMQILRGRQPWPACREGHPHPMELSTEGEEDWPAWRCPKNRAYRLPLGQHPGQQHAPERPTGH
ncbi:hypothetical protein [Streptomyces torulosus]|uniref:hypothetical protein n=1 Tax=Streptomyces torulosus TaxID=68276 RepID=UPI000A8DF468|nr:hypothetical protein [Streptomyces torulosus]